MFNSNFILHCRETRPAKDPHLRRCRHDYCAVHCRHYRCHSGPRRKAQQFGSKSHDRFYLHQHYVLCRHLGPGRLGGNWRDLPTPNPKPRCWIIHCVQLVLELCKHFFKLHCTTGIDKVSQIISVITPYLVGTAKGDANMGAKVFFLWGSLCCISFSFAYFLVPVSPPPCPKCAGPYTDTYLVGNQRSYA